MEPAPPSLLCRASLCFVMGQRELDAVTRRFAARHVLTAGHTAAVLRARRIAGDLTGHDDLLHGKRVVISEVMSTIKNFPECRQFCCVIDSLPSKPLLMGRCHTQRNDQRKKAKGECCRAHLTYLLDEIRQHSATAAKFQAPVHSAIRSSRKMALRNRAVFARRSVPLDASSTLVLPGNSKILCRRDGWR
jgi:hypothetical protein